MQVIPLHSRAHHVLETSEGTLCWHSQTGPRGPVVFGGTLDGQAIQPYELRLRLLAFATDR